MKAVKPGTIKLSAIISAYVSREFCPESDCYHDIMKAYLAEDDDALEGLLNVIDNFEDADGPDEYCLLIKTENGNWRPVTPRDAAGSGDG